MECFPDNLRLATRCKTLSPRLESNQHRHVQETRASPLGYAGIGAGPENRTPCLQLKRMVLFLISLAGTMVGMARF